jgi:RNA polymerase sigma-70 factor, ECF subfamily
LGTRRAPDIELTGGREVEDRDGSFADSLVSPSEQEGHVGLEELREALQELPDDQREAVILVGAVGMIYEEAAEICGCAVGTVKSRVHRAREKLAQLLAIEDEHDLAFDRIHQAVIFRREGAGTYSI